MRTPVVTEIARPTESVTRDTFIDNPSGGIAAACLPTGGHRTKDVMADRFSIVLADSARGRPPPQGAPTSALSR